MAKRKVTKYIPVVFEFIDDYTWKGQPTCTDWPHRVKVMIDYYDFNNELVIDYTGSTRRALSPRFAFSSHHCSGKDTRHVVTYFMNAHGTWDIITHPHGRSCGSVRYSVAATEREAQDYVRGYMNRRFRRLNKFV